MTPSWRKPAGALLMLASITIWAILVVSLSRIIAGWPVLAQMAFYALTGLIWIMPMKPLLRWMETGRWRA
ncbi:DUF2842 domain-containing protein [Sphingomonas sp. 28-63-12]|uniref:DUF2842 domain-containing protein n=1 Tax=Sphingomonas sp. 28-63-12 TaxID=1970434 RepID=UPI000BDC2CE0|nr:MAG: hypothetical protein B7Y47_16825 [Sphingomonas sp. 28-63-12]